MPFADREQQLQQLLLPVGVQAAHHPEIEERDAPVVGQEDVAWMRVGVEEAVDDDLVQIGAEQLQRQPLAVDLLPRQRREIRDLPSL